MELLDDQTTNINTKSNPVWHKLEFSFSPDVSRVYLCNSVLRLKHKYKP